METAGDNVHDDSQKSKSDEDDMDELEREEANEAAEEEEDERVSAEVEIVRDEKNLALTKMVKAWVQCGDFKKRNRRALLPHQMVHKQPFAMKKGFLTAPKRDARAARVLFDDLKELYVDNFEADFVIVLKPEKKAFIKEQLQGDVDIWKYHPDIDKTAPRL